MRVIPVARLVFSLVLSVFASLSVAADRASINIAILEFPPFSVVDPETGRLGGSIVELTRRAFAEVDVDVEYTVLPFARSVAVAESGEFDATGMLNAATSESLLLSGSPVGAMVQTFYTRASDAWQYDGVASLHGRSVVNVAGYDYSPVSAEFQAFLESDANVVEVSSSTDYLDRVFKMLLNGRADVYNEASVIADFKLEQLGLRDDIAVAGVLGDLPLHIGFKPDDEGKAFKALFDTGMAALAKP